MSAKVIHSLTDENPDLHKQIGCMNGIFQLFNRRHFPAARRISSHSHKRPPPGQSGNHGTEPNSTMQKTIEKHLDEVVREKRRVSVESSRTSFSSSCSSTFSSVDCNRTAKLEPSSLGQSNFHETPSPILPKKEPSSSLDLGPQSLDLRAVVKDSINREACGISVKTTATGERTNHVLKHIDSPRPLQPSKSVKPKVSGLDGSFRVLVKLREAPRNSNEDKSLALPPKDTPRFSYDGRESRDKWKSTLKLKELPRLSLDSRESSIRRSASDSRSNYLLDDSERRNAKSSQTLNPQQEPGSNTRPSSVVAKLMGLEAFPDSMPAYDDQIKKIKCCPDEDLDAISTTSTKADESKHYQVSRSPRTPQGKPFSLQSRNIRSIVKPNSGFPLEPAPWRKPDRNGVSEKPASKYQEAQLQTKAQNTYLSVYGEIEKRLMEIEFKRSGKDLRALKQILDAKRKTRESLENKKEEKASDLEPQTSNEVSNYHNLEQNSMSEMNCSQQSIHRTSPTIKETGPPKNFESSVVSMKPAKVVQRPGHLCSSAIPLEGMSGLRKLRTSDNAANKRDAAEKPSPNDLTPRNSHFREPSCETLCSMDKSRKAKTYRATQTSKASQHTSGGISTSPGRRSTAVSPRLQQKKHGTETQSHPTTPTSDSRRARKHLSKQQIESDSPSRKFKAKSSNLQQCIDQLSELSRETRQLSHQGDAISVQSESNISSASQTDIEVTSIDRSTEIYGTHKHEDKNNKIEARLSEDRSKAETTTSTLEQPSPVSVLDTAFYREGSPSPVKKTSNAFKDEESLNFDEAEWNSVYLEDMLNSTRSKLGPEFDREKLENIKHLVHKLRQVNSTHDEAATDYVRSVCETTNPEHRYITRILSASGLLFKDLGSSSTFIQLHPSGHLINPNLFFVLEQTQGRIEHPDDERSNEKIDQSKFNEKNRRKLIFDTVNEILVRKLTSAGYSEPWISPNNLGVRSLAGHKLLKDLCSEMDHLQANTDCSLHDEDDGSLSILSEDMMLQTQNWKDCHAEIPGVVLDIERLIFKDLIAEVVSGEAAGQPGRPAKHCRQLFPE